MVVCVEVAINSLYQYLQSCRLSTRYDSSIEVTMLSKPDKIMLPFDFLSVLVNVARTKHSGKSI